MRTAGSCSVAKCIVRCRRVNRPFRISGDVCRAVLGGPSSERIKTFAASEESVNAMRPRCVPQIRSKESDRVLSIVGMSRSMERAWKGGIVANLQFRGGEGGAEIAADEIDNAADDRALDFCGFAFE